VNAASLAEKTTQGLLSTAAVIRQTEVERQQTVSTGYSLPTGQRQQMAVFCPPQRAVVGRLTVA